MKGLKIILWILAISFMAGFVVIFIPWSVIEWIYSMAGEQPMSNTPLNSYSLRVTGGMVGAIGIYFLFLALNPIKYRQLVIFSSYALIAGGLLCVIIGLAVGVKPTLPLGDTLFGLILGILLLFQSFKALKR